MALITSVEDDARVWNRTDTVCARLGSVRDIVLYKRHHIRDLIQIAMHSHLHTSMLADRGVPTTALKVMLYAVHVELQIGRSVLDADRSGFGPPHLLACIMGFIRSTRSLHRLFWLCYFNPLSVNQFGASFLGLSSGNCDWNRLTIAGFSTLGDVTGLSTSTDHELRRR